MPLFWIKIAKKHYNKSLLQPKHVIGESRSLAKFIKHLHCTPESILVSVSQIFWVSEFSHLAWYIRSDSYVEFFNLNILYRKNGVSCMPTTNYVIDVNSGEIDTIGATEKLSAMQLKKQEPLGLLRCMGRRLYLGAKEGLKMRERSR